MRAGVGTLNTAGGRQWGQWLHRPWGTDRVWPMAMGRMTQTQGCFKDQISPQGLWRCCCWSRTAARAAHPNRQPHSPPEWLRRMETHRHCSTLASLPLEPKTVLGPMYLCERGVRNALGTAQRCLMQRGLTWQTEQSRNRQWLEST